MAYWNIRIFLFTVYLEEFSISALATNKCEQVTISPA